jgi:hypothetical protein
MAKLHRSLAICIFGVALAALSTSAQTYTQVDFPGALDTALNGGPNPEGTSVGSWFDGTNFHGFILSSGNVFTSFDPPGSTSTTPNFISPQGEIVGGYTDSSGTTHGFTLNQTTYTTVDYPGAVFTILTGLSPSGVIVGEYSSASANPLCIGGPSGACHSFQVSKKGVLISFDPPGATSSGASTVNPSGVIVGAYNDASGVQHGYQLDKKGNYTTIDFPGATSTFVGGNNATGAMVGEYVDTSNVGHSFILSGATYTSFDPPFGGVTFSVATGINPSGVIVGTFFDAAFNEHGYIRTP